MEKMLKSLDVFGAPIGVNYKGNSTYQTKLGGIFSILAFILVMF
jgi:hypothetical protein